MDEPTLSEIYRVLLSVEAQAKQTNGRLRAAETAIAVLQASAHQPNSCAVSGEIFKDIQSLKEDRAANVRAMQVLIAIATLVATAASSAVTWGLDRFLR